MRSGSTGIDQRKDLLHHALVAELVKKLHGTTERVCDVYEASGNLFHYLAT
jgi:hypothetical protein